MQNLTRLLLGSDGTLNLVVIVPVAVAVLVLGGALVALLRWRFGAPGPTHAADWAHAAYSIWTGGEDCGDWGGDRARNALESWYGITQTAGFWQTIRGLQEGHTHSAAWDQVRAIDLLRIGTAAGYISEDECWEHVTSMAHTLSEKFESWEALAADFEAGMHRWQSGRGVKDPQQRQRVQRNLPYLRKTAWPEAAFKAPLEH